MTVTYTTRVTGLRVRGEGEFSDVVRAVDFVVSGVDRPRFFSDTVALSTFVM